MSKTFYPWKSIRNIGKVIHLHYKEASNNTELKWFAMCRNPFTKEWFQIGDLDFEDYLATIDVGDEVYAVEDLDRESANKRAAKWRGSHEKERFLMEVLWREIGIHLPVFLWKEPNSYLVKVDWHERGYEIFIKSNTLLKAAIPFANNKRRVYLNPRMEALCGDSLEWVYPTILPGQNDYAIVSLTQKGFESIRSLLPPFALGAIDEWNNLLRPCNIATELD